MKGIKHIVTNWITRKLLKAVTEDEVLILSGKDWMIGTRKMTNEQILQIKEEAKSLKTSLLYKYLVREVKYHATLQRFDLAKTADDMLFGKAMLYAIHLVQKFIKNIADL